MLVGGLLGLVIALAALAGGLLWQWRQAAAKAEQQSRELEAISKLIHGLRETDLHHASHDLVEQLVHSGQCQAAVLVTMSESGALEPLAAACSGDQAAWEPEMAAVAKGVIERQRAERSSAGDLFLPLSFGPEGQGLLVLRQVGEPRLVLDLAAKISGLTLAGIHLYQKQLALSSTDGLTGLSNHRHFQQVLGVALGQAYLQGSSLCMILVDIDHFKQVNDTYGHLLGDLVLREIAYLIRRTMPPGTLVARYGGEEIVILLQDEDAQRAPELAERLRETVANHQFMDFATGTKLQVTISQGVAQYELGQGKSRLIARADEALYNSKREGRNRVTVAPLEAVSPSVLPS